MLSDSGQDNMMENGIIITDSYNDQYRFTYNSDTSSITAHLDTLDGIFVSESILQKSTGDVLNIFNTAFDSCALSNNETESNDSQIIEYTTNIADYCTDILTANSNRANGYGYDPNYNYSFRFLRTGRTDYNYNGKILTGDCYYRCTGNYTDTIRESYTFAKNTLLTAVSVALGLKFGIGNDDDNFMSELVYNILSVLGIAYAGGQLTQDINNMVVSLRCFEYEFKTTMNGLAVCILTRTIDYVLGEYNNRVGLCGVDMLSYKTEDAAIRGYCDYSLSIAGSAFEAKFITKTKPNLALPVTGPKNTWL